MNVSNIDVAALNKPVEERKQRGVLKYRVGNATVSKYSIK